MGYRNPNGKLLTVDIKSANQLRGFRIFAARDHISGIQLYTGAPVQVGPCKEMELNSSEWLGSAPASQDAYGCFNRTCTGKKITALGASFDGWKMNSFQIGIEQTRKPRSTESQRLRGKQNAAKRKRST
ncbi:hypothetical protein N7528_006926 [Penicillium herquei]|nr:hypothetical protein N7528_006926 [Penicillium herquei]